VTKPDFVLHVGILLSRLKTWSWNS